MCNFWVIFEFNRFCKNRRNSSTDFFFKRSLRRLTDVKKYYLKVSLTLFSGTPFNLKMKTTYEPAERFALQIIFF